MKKTSLPRLIAVAAALALVICLFLPFASAKDETRELLMVFPDEIMYQKLDMTAEDMVNVSMLEYVQMYMQLSDEFYVDEATGLLCTVLVVMFGLFALLCLLFAALKKPIPVIIFGILALGVFSLLKFDFTDRGAIPNAAYDWGYAVTVVYVAIIVLLVAAIWLIVAKNKEKNAQQATATYE